MKCIILAGGFAKRLWPLTKEVPKSLLQIGDKPIISHIIDKVDSIEDVDEIIITTNEHWANHFNEYLKDLKTQKKTSLFVEPIRDESSKLGSVGSLGYLLNTLDISGSTLILAGDNLFEFDIAHFIDKHKKNRASRIAVKRLEDKNMLPYYGICEIDSKGKVTGFEEKPKNPNSNLVSTGCYLLNEDDIKLVSKYLALGLSADAMGSFVSWLVQVTHIDAHSFEESWYDIGDFKTLEFVQAKYSKPTL